MTIGVAKHLGYGPLGDSDALRACTNGREDFLAPR
jgi:hypothetical protein